MKIERKDGHISSTVVEKLALLAISAACFIGGFYLLCVYVNWQAAIAVILLLWSHNIEEHQKQ